MKATKEELLGRISILLDTPCVCLDSQKVPILKLAQDLSIDQLCEVCVLLKIRTHSLNHVARSPEKMKMLQKTRTNLDNLLAKHGIYP